MQSKTLVLISKLIFFFACQKSQEEDPEPRFFEDSLYYSLLANQIAAEDPGKAAKHRE